MVLIVAAAMLGFLGLRLGNVAARSGNLEVDVRYATITRAGLPTPFTIEVSTRDGSPLPDRVEVALSSDYFALFDENGLDPEPVESDADGENTYLTFEPTGGHSTLAIDFDARAQTDVHWGTDAQVTIGAGGDEATVDFRTRVAP